MCSLPLHSSVCCNWSLSAFFSFQRLSTTYFQLPEGPVSPPVCMNSGACCMYRELSGLSGRKPFFITSLQCSSFYIWEAGSSVSVAQLVPFVTMLFTMAQNSQISLLCHLPTQIGYKLTYEHWLGFTKYSPQSTSAMVVWQNCLSLHLIHLSCCKK